MSFPIQMQVTWDGVVTMSMQQALMRQDAGLKLRAWRARHGGNSEEQYWCLCPSERGW